MVKRAPVKVGTRGSRLALAQTEQVLQRLRELHPRVKFVAVPIKTAGDRITSAKELRRAGKGLFVKEIERALLKRRISLAVHSMKDLPSELPKGLEIGAVLEREDPSDAFIGIGGATIEKLPPKAKVGTSSLRRQAILKALHPHLVFVEMRGNLDTRLEKLMAPRSPVAGIVVAAAGLRRLFGENGVAVQILPRETVVPAAGQGALALEVRERDEASKRLIAPLHHGDTAACVRAERELLRRLEGGCQVPLGVHAGVLDEGLITLTACLARVDGTDLIRETQTGDIGDPEHLAETLERTLVARGAREILSGLRPRGRSRRRRR